jgi:hypothetical protein
MIGAMLLEAWHAMGANRLRTFLTMLDEAATRRNGPLVA